MVDFITKLIYMRRSGLDDVHRISPQIAEHQCPHTEKALAGRFHVAVDQVGVECPGGSFQCEGKRTGRIVKSFRYQIDDLRILLVRMTDITSQG